MPTEYKKIAYVKTAWSDSYNGEPVKGNFGYVRGGHQGHEKFNFKPGSTYYATIPPIGGSNATPKPRHRDGWLLIFISADQGTGPLKVVGWYENASFERRPLPRPEYKSQYFETDDRGRQYTYCVSARRAHLIPVGKRPLISIGDRMKRSPILYVRGNRTTEPWRERLARKAESLVREFGARVSGAKLQSRGSGRPWYATKEHREAVDKAAIEHVKGQLGGQYHIQDRQPEKCGYDLLATHKASHVQLQIEVKGTSMARPGFFMTPNELAAIDSPKWRLALVTNALTNPKYHLLNKREMNRDFNIKPRSFVGTFRGTTLANKEWAVPEKSKAATAGK